MASSSPAKTKAPVLAAVTAFLLAGVVAAGGILLPTSLRASGGEQTRLDVLVTGPPFFSILALTTAVVVALLGVALLQTSRQTRASMPPRTRARVAVAVILGVGSLLVSMLIPTGHGALLAVAALWRARSDDGLDFQGRPVRLAVRVAAWVGLLVAMVYLLTGVGLCGPRFLLFACDA